MLVLNEDIIGDRFWKEHPEILDPKAKVKNNLTYKKSSNLQNIENLPEVTKKLLI